VTAPTLNALLSELERAADVFQGVCVRVIEEAGNTTHYMDVAAYARFANQSEQTVRRWARDGEVPAQKVHGQWRFEVRS
jgi:hypothetical protein